MRKVTLIEAPIDFSAYGHKEGAGSGPQKIRELQIANILRKNNVDVSEVTNIKIPNTNNVTDITSKFEGETAEASINVKNAVIDSLKNQRLPITIGGDHTVALGTIAGVNSFGKKTGILWIDAHADANTPETTTSGNIHGMVAANIMGYNHRVEMKKIFDSNYIDQQNFVYLGLRNVDSPERELIKKDNILNFTIWDIERDGIEIVSGKALNYLSKKCDRLHISLDLDVVDEIWAPGVGISTEGGLTYREIIYLAHKLSKSNFSSLDVVELNTKTDIDNKTAELALELICAFLGVNYGAYERFRDKRGPLLK